MLEETKALESLGVELKPATSSWRFSATPVAVEIGAWLAQYEQARRDEAVRQRLDAAAQRLIEVERTLQEERLAPSSVTAARSWDELKQESNVDLTDIDLIAASACGLQDRGRRRTGRRAGRDEPG